MSASATPIAIRGEPQANSELCRFVVTGHVLYAAGSHLCASATQARGSPLLERLFAIKGISQALVSGDTVTLQKSSDRTWPEIGKEVGAALREHFAINAPFAPPVQAHRAGTGSLGLASETLAARVREVLDTQINPGVAGHGGKIELVELQGSRAILKMSGGCQGCGAAKVTLKQGVEKALLAQFPEITEIVDSTDHSAGQTPYYARG